MKRLWTGAAVALVLGGLGFQTAAADPDSAKRLAKGKLLVAGRDMLDPNFARTAVLLLEHGDDGSVGVVINRPSGLGLKDLLGDDDGLAGYDLPVYLGGPVGPTQMLFLFGGDRPPEECRPILPGVCAGGDRDLLAELLANGTQDGLRLYAGYSGWAPGQLEWELEQDGWHVLPGDKSMVFSADPQRVWPLLIERTYERLALDQR